MKGLKALFKLFSIKFHYGALVTTCDSWGFPRINRRRRFMLAGMKYSPRGADDASDRVTFARPRNDPASSFPCTIKRQQSQAARSAGSSQPIS